jgi:hypothetical protein
MGLATAWRARNGASLLQLAIWRWPLLPAPPVTVRDFTSGARTREKLLKLQMGGNAGSPSLPEIARFKPNPDGRSHLLI